MVDAKNITLLYAKEQIVQPYTEIKAEDTLWEKNTSVSMTTISRYCNYL